MCACVQGGCGWRVSASVERAVIVGVACVVEGGEMW